jgi:activating signal cointegrator complex subunit 3
MVFVHARNDTVRTAMVLRDLAKNKNDVGFFLPEQSRQYGEAEKNVNRSKVKVPQRSLWYATHCLMVMHPHTIYN